MKNAKLLFDTSSFIYAINQGCIALIYGNYTQFLTIYELINVIWKELRLTKSISEKEAVKLIGILSEVLRFTRVLSPLKLEKEILKIATVLDITAYDASYVALAKQHNLTLVTEDRKLRSKAAKLINVKSIVELRK